MQRNTPCPAKLEMEPQRCDGGEVEGTLPYRDLRQGSEVSRPAKKETFLYRYSFV